VAQADLFGLPEGFVAVFKDVYFSTNIADEAFTAPKAELATALTLDGDRFAG